MATVSGNPDPLIGAEIDGKYTIVELIGRGGMGAVYKAEHNLMGRMVAIKFLKLKELDESSEEYLRRFKQEAQTASQLRHPSAITIYDYGVGDFGGRDASPFLVMEYIRGDTLKKAFKEGPLKPERLIPLMLQVCGALEEAHKLGIVHRDLKPDNIMMSERGDGSEWAHVLDFGIAKKILGNTAEGGMTKTGNVIGTPKYMSPEQILTKPVDQRADVYALGLMMYEALTGNIPFSSESLMELAVMHVKEKPIPLLKRAPNCGATKNLEKVVMRALSKDPDERQHSAKELSQEMKEAYPLDYDDSSNTYSFGAIKSSSRRRKGSPIKTVAVGAFILLAIGGAYALQGGFSDSKSQASVSTTSTKPTKAQLKTEATREALKQELMGSSPGGTIIKAPSDTTVSTAKKPVALLETPDASPVPEKPSIAEAKDEKATPSPAPVAAVKTAPKVDTAAQEAQRQKGLEAERKLKNAQKRAAAMERKAREAERQARASEARRKAADAQRKKDEKASTPPPPPPEKSGSTAPKIRRRCGPTWCP